MQCANCNHENPAEARFCSACGSGLPPVCSACGAAGEPGGAFCNACGTAFSSEASARAVPSVPAHLAQKIRDARGSLDGEPRMVTVLFVDTVDSMAATEGMDLETLHQAVRDRSQIMADAVYEYEGTVLQFLGDGIMAVFGAPIAHEDNARRAVAAALAMRDNLAAHAATLHSAGGFAPQYRIGLNTGPVIVGGIGDDLSMDYTAVGDTVNLAARMEQAAQPDTIYITAETERQTAGYFAFRGLGGLAVKGKTDPVSAYEVVRTLRARTRFDVAQQRGLTPLVGRDAELATLRNYFEHAKQGEGQVVSIVGEAGIGKSRLVMEFRQSLLGESLTWLQGQCITYGRSIPYTPLLDVLKEAFGIDESDDPARIIAKVCDGTTEWEQAARETAPYLRFLLSVDPGDDRIAQMDAMERRAGILEALHAILAQTSRHAPLVLVIEDLHWIDIRSEEAVHSLVDAVATLPVLLVLTYRPGYETAIPERGSVSRLALRTLSGDSAVAVARGLLNSAELPEDVCKHLTAKAGGNPFYVEEVTRHLVEAGILERTNGSYTLARPLAADDIPNTIHDVIRARMDRLEVEERETLQLAAVIGREFTARLLERLAARTDRVSQEVRALQNVELILEKSHFPEMAYMFKHALTCDVAYESLLAERRRGLHRLIAAAVEELYADRLVEHYGTLAHHSYEGQEWEKALTYLRLAAEKAAARDAVRDALAHYTRALEACDHVGAAADETRRGVHGQMADLYRAVSDLPSALASSEQVRALARAAGDRKAEGVAITDIAFTQMWHHQFAAAQQSLTDAMRIGRELNDAGIRGRALAILGEMEGVRGRMVPALEALTEAVPLCVAAHYPSGWARSLSNLALGFNWGGRFEDALLQYEPYDAAPDEPLLLMEVLYVTWTRALVKGGAGRYRDAFSELHACVQRCRRVGEVAFQSRGWNTLGWLHNDLYDWARGSEYNERGLRLGISLGDHEIQANARLNLGDAALGSGDRDQARRILQELYESLPDLHEWMKWRYSQHCYHSLGETLLALGDPVRAHELATECLESATQTDSRKNMVKAHRLLGQTLVVEGAPAEAEAEYQVALALAREVGNPPQLWKSWHALGDLHAQQGQVGPARAAHREALGVIERAAAEVADADLKATFMAAPVVAAIGAAADR